MARVIALLHHTAPSDRPSRKRTFWRVLFAVWLDPYRPERHYMRGPGPKWRAKHRRDA